MDQLSSVIAAFSAGKLPTTAQANVAIDRLLESKLLELEDKIDAADAPPELSEDGKALVRNLRELCECYKQIGSEKNGDDVLQEALWNLSGAESEAADGEGPTEAGQDAHKFGAALRGLVGSILAHLGSEGGDLFAEFASFSRATLADVAEMVEAGAGATKERLRSTEEDVQAGKRDALGRSKDKDGDEDMDARQRFEKGMDQAKGVGSETIGVAQDTSARVKELGNNTSQRLDDALWRVCDRAQKDEEYHSQIDALFTLVHKWVGRSVSSAQTAAHADDPSSSTDLESQVADLVQDPTGRLPDGLRGLRTFAERFAGGKSLETLYAAAARCAADVRDDKDVRACFDEWEAYMRKCMDEPGYLRSDACKKRREEIAQKWEKVKEGEKGKKWKEDTEKFWEEYDSFADAVCEDGSLNRLKKAHKAIAVDVANLSGALAQTAVGQGQWLWQDVVNVWLPRFFAQLKDIPLPRMEYVDSKAELVLENVDISTLAILPGHAFISHTTEMNIDAPENKVTTTDVSTKTRIQFTGVQLDLRSLSFYYRDKASSFIQDPITGLLDVKLPPEGLDLDITVSLIPTASGTAEREERYGFHRIENVSANLHSLDVHVRKSNKQILLSLFQPIFRAGVSSALKSSIETHVQLALESFDRAAYDIHKRAQVFDDAGLPSAGAYLGGLVSFIGKKRKEAAADPKPGVLEGLRVTGVGLVKDDPREDKKVAVGAGPQILSGDKHGPIGNFAGQPASGLDNKLQEGKDQVKGALSQAKAKAGEAKEKVLDFKESVEEKRQSELKKEGWKTDAFDL